MTGVRPDDTAGTGERLGETARGISMDVWLRLAPNDPAHVTFESCHLDGVHTGASLAAIDALVAAVREAEARADQLANERVELQNSIGGYIVSTDELVRQRADAWRECESLAEELAEAEARADGWRTSTETARAALDRAVRDLRDEQERAEREERALQEARNWIADDSDAASQLGSRRLRYLDRVLAAVSGEAPRFGTPTPKNPNVPNSGEAPNDE